MPKKVPDASKYDIEAVRKEWIGQKGEMTKGRYPVEYDPIRRHEHMAGGTNPLFLDPEWCAKNSPHGDVVAPPVMVDMFAGPGAWPRKGGFTDSMSGPMGEVPTIGDRFVNLNTDWEFLRPLKIGDRISSQQVLDDLYIKPVRMDPKSVWIVMRTDYFDQNNELVAQSRNTLMTHRAPEEVAADPDTPKA